MKTADMSEVSECCADVLCCCVVLIITSEPAVKLELRSNNIISGCYQSLCFLTIFIYFFLRESLTCRLIFSSLMSTGH